MGLRSHSLPLLSIPTFPLSLSPSPPPLDSYLPSLSPSPLSIPLDSYLPSLSPPPPPLTLFHG